jgi:hypothetical protein
MSTNIVLTVNLRSVPEPDLSESYYYDTGTKDASGNKLYDYGRLRTITQRPTNIYTIGEDEDRIRDVSVVYGNDPEKYAIDTGKNGGKSRRRKLRKSRKRKSYRKKF